MLFADNLVTFPASRTFRHPGTQDVYILGVTRQDAQGGTPYVGLTICQLVTEGGSAGLATITRKAPAGPSSDPGWLVDTVVAKAHMDMEFRTSATEPGTTDLKIENYYAYLPSTVECEPWDFVHLHGKAYRVVDTFADSGLAGLRIDHEADVRLDFVLHVEGQRQYNHTTHQYEQADASYNVTGVLESSNSFALWTSDSSTYMDAYFEAAHVPFAPPAGKCWLEIGGVKRAVKTVTTQSGTRQYHLRCL
ncbi:hypothetical protein D3C86_1323750 [compost metagenome]